MGFQEMLSELRETLTAQRVYGEPYERNGLTVIPAASVRGGGGGGGGEGDEGRGSGGGFGLSAAPKGAWVITGDKVVWKPAVDVNRVVLGGQIVALAAIITIGSIARARARRRQVVDLGPVVRAIGRLPLKPIRH